MWLVNYRPSQLVLRTSLSKWLILTVVMIFLPIKFNNFPMMSPIFWPLLSSLLQCIYKHWDLWKYLLTTCLPTSHQRLLFASVVFHQPFLPKLGIIWEIRRVNDMFRLPLIIIIILIICHLLFGFWPIINYGKVNWSLNCQNSRESMGQCYFGLVASYKAYSHKQRCPSWGAC